MAITKYFFFFLALNCIPHRSTSAIHVANNHFYTYFSRSSAKPSCPFFFPFKSLTLISPIHTVQYHNMFISIYLHLNVPSPYLGRPFCLFHCIYQTSVEGVKTCCYKISVSSIVTNGAHHFSTRSMQFVTRYLIVSYQQ